jgi:hypothetical protein
MSLLDKAKAVLTRLEADPKEREVAAEDTFRRAYGEVSDRWRDLRTSGDADWHEHIRRCHPETWRALKKAEEDVEGTWVRVLGEGTSLEAFRAACEAWRDIYLGFIEEHRWREENPEDTRQAQAACSPRVRMEEHGKNTKPCCAKGALSEKSPDDEQEDLLK